ncbi:VOC family protein [Phenylobacterium sp.]|uniref:VOC family protein n=1 Tax=Phenylobacterium sp. TaxID=1871053 RepID=UPI0025CDE8DC|nr:VOC family protein [Phenylobacterium sp.]
MAQVLGIGGVFVKAQDTGALAEWYARVLGFPTEGGHAMWPPPAGGFTLWSPFQATSDYFDPSTQPFMLNLRVDDIDGMVARVEAAGEALMGRQDESYGRFAWLMDPQGLKIELWEHLEPPA